MSHHESYDSTVSIFTSFEQTADEYEAWMKNISAQYNSSTMLLSKYSPWAYDAAWALAVGLNRSIKHMGSGELENFSYNRSDIYDAIQKGMEEVFFQGVSVIWFAWSTNYIFLW